MDIQIDISNIILETERLILRPWKELELEDFYEYASVPGWKRWQAGITMSQGRLLKRYWILS